MLGTPVLRGTSVLEAWIVVDIFMHISFLTGGEKSTEDDEILKDTD